MEISNSIWLFGLVSLISFSVWVLRMYKKEAYYRSIKESFMWSIVNLSKINDNLMFYIKDKNGKYLSGSPSLISNVYQDLCCEDVRNKTDYEIKTGKELKEIKENDIHINYKSSDKISLEYKNIDKKELKYIASDLIILKHKKPYRFIELIEDNLLLDIVKYPIFNGKNLLYILGTGMVLAKGKDAVKEFNEFKSCSKLTKCLKTIEDTNILMIDLEENKGFIDSIIKKNICSAEYSH